MKKFLMLLLSVVAGIFATSAKVTLVDGDIAAFYNAEVNVLFDDGCAFLEGENATADEFFQRQDHIAYARFLLDLEASHDYFVNAINEGGQFLITNKAQRLLLKIKVDRLRIGRIEKPARMSGVIELVDKETGFVLCKLSMQNVKGKRSFIFKGRAAKAYMKLARELMKLIKSKI